MRIIRDTMYLSCEDLSEGLATGNAICVPEKVKAIALDHDALEMALIHDFGGGIDDPS